MNASIQQITHGQQSLYGMKLHNFTNQNGIAQKQKNGCTQLQQISVYDELISLLHEPNGIGQNIEVSSDENFYISSIHNHAPHYLNHVFLSFSMQHNQQKYPLHRQLNSKHLI